MEILRAMRAISLLSLIALPAVAETAVAQSWMDSASRNNVCMGALKIDRSDWDPRPEAGPWVAEARKRGLGVADCARILASPTAAEPAAPAPSAAASSSRPSAARPDTKPAQKPAPAPPDALVAAIQTLLAALGRQPGPADGRLGPRTRQAIAAFQESVGDPPDGMPSEGLRAKLQAAIAARPPSAMVGSPANRRPRGQPTGSGSAFYVGQHILLTSFHVVEDCTEIRLKRNGVDAGSVELKGVNRGDDLAVLRTEEVQERFLPLRLAPPLMPAEQVIVFGFPLASALSSQGNTTLGHITALTGLRDDSRFVQISAAVQPGNSGGPVLDDKGRLVALVAGKLNAARVLQATGDIPQNVNFAVKASVLAGFLDLQQVSYVTAPVDSENLAGTEIARRAAAASVQVACYR